MYRKSESLCGCTKGCTAVDGCALGSVLSVSRFGENIISVTATKIVRMSKVRMEYRKIGVGSQGCVEDVRMLVTGQSGITSVLSERRIQFADERRSEVKY